MLSASTVSSASSSAFSSSSATTPSSQYSMDSAKKSTGNPLTDLIEAEKSYLETLKIIDMQIAPIWMKQPSPAPDFYDLLGYVHDMYRANKRFCSKLVKIAGNPQVFRELGDVLMQWVEDMEVPYANFSRSFINDLNKRQDIQENPQIRQLLNNLSANVPYEITLESLFNAPNQQLKYYKMLYSRLLDGTDPGRADHKLLLQANKRIDMIMIMAQRTMPRNISPLPPRGRNEATEQQPRGIKGTAPLPQINTGFQEHHNNSAGISGLEQQIDSLRVADIFSGIRVKYQLRLNPVSKIVLRDNFVLLPDQNGGATARVHLILTNEVLIVCREQPGLKPYSLIYPPLRNHDIQVKSASIERELVGEYIIQFSILGKKNLTMRADEKETRNIWLGLEPNVSSSLTLTARPLISTVQKYHSQPGNKNTTAMLTTPTDQGSRDRGAVSPLDDDDKNTPQFDEKTYEPPKIIHTALPSRQNDDSDDSPDSEDHEFKSMLLSGRSPNVPVNQPKPENKFEDIIPRTVMMFPQVPGHSPASAVGKLPSLSSGSPAAEPDRIAVKEPTKSTTVKMTFIPPVAVQKMTIVSTEPGALSVETRNLGISSDLGSLALDDSPKAENPNGSEAVQSSSPSQQLRSKVSEERPAIPNIESMNRSGSPHPVSPRPIEVRQGVSPVAMQAVTQANNYISAEASSPQTQNDPKPQAMPTNKQPFDDRERVKPPPLIQTDPRLADSRRENGPNNSSAPTTPNSTSPLGKGPSIQQNQNITPRGSSRNIPGDDQQVYNQQQPRQQIPPQQYQNGPRSQIPPQQYQQQPRQQIPPQQYQQPLQHHQGYPNGYGRPLGPGQPMASQSSPYRGPGPQQSSNMLSPRIGPAYGGPQKMAPSPNSSRTPSPQRSISGHPHPGLNTPSPSPSRSFGTASPSPHLQPGQPYSPDDSSSPPHSPNPLGSQANGIKQVIYSSSECEVFHWKDKTWYAAEGRCLLQIKLTHSNRACVAVQIQTTGHLYLNAWILPTTVIRQPSETDVSISVFMGNRKENYLVHFHNPNDALSFLHILQQMHYESCQARPYQHPILPRSTSIGNQQNITDNKPAENVPQSLQPVMQFKCKLFLQNETSSWSPFGSVSMRISQQIPSKKMHIYIENEKNKLVSSIVRSGNVERVGNKKVTFLLKNEQERTSLVYMIQLKDESTASKTYDYLRVKNSEAEW